MHWNKKSISLNVIVISEQKMADTLKTQFLFILFKYKIQKQ